MSICNEHSIRLVRIEMKLEELIVSVAVLSDTFQKYVTHERFRPTELVAMGLAAIALATVVSAMLTKVMHG